MGSRAETGDGDCSYADGLKYEWLYLMLPVVDQLSERHSGLRTLGWVIAVHIAPGEGRWQNSSLCDLWRQGRARGGVSLLQCVEVVYSDEVAPVCYLDALALLRIEYAKVIRFELDAQPDMIYQTAEKCLGEEAESKASCSASPSIWLVWWHLDCQRTGSLPTSFMF